MRYFKLFFVVLLWPITGYAQTDTLLLDLKKTSNSDDELYDEYKGSLILELPTSGITNFKIQAGAGELEISQSNLPLITVEAEVGVYASNESKVDEILSEELDLSLEKKAGQAHLRSYIAFDDDQDRGFTPFEFFKAPYRFINLKIKVPAGISLDIDDQGGDIVLAGLTNDVKLNDNSGYIYCNNTNGSLTISDNSGDIFLKNINQDIASIPNIVIDDNSGEIKIINARGNIRLDDTSGGIYLENIKGNARIDDTSDDIRVFDLDGDLEIDDNSGDINGRNIGGHAIISDNSGDIILRKVLLDVNIKNAGSGDLWLSDISGNVSGDLRKLSN